MGIDQLSERCRDCNAIKSWGTRCANCMSKASEAAVLARVRLHHAGVAFTETQGAGYERERTTILRAKELVAPPPRREYFCTDEVGNPVQWNGADSKLARDQAFNEEVDTQQRESARRLQLRTSLAEPPKLALTVGTVTDFETALGHMQRSRGVRYRMIGEPWQYEWERNALMSRHGLHGPWAPVPMEGHLLHQCRFERVS